MLSQQQKEYVIQQKGLDREKEHLEYISLSVSGSMKGERRGDRKREILMDGIIPGYGSCNHGGWQVMVCGVSCHGRDPGRADVTGS